MTAKEQEKIKNSPFGTSNPEAVQRVYQCCYNYCGEFGNSDETIGSWIERARHT